MSEDILKLLLAIALPLLYGLFKRMMRANSTSGQPEMEWEEIHEPAPSPSRPKQKPKSKPANRFLATGKEEGSAATSLTAPEPPLADEHPEDFSISSLEEIRRAIVWGEILHRKY